MAMTTFPNCGEQISDKAKKCVHCGAILVTKKRNTVLTAGQNWKKEWIHVRNVVAR